MIVTQLYKGQGLGNQLWCYVTTRVIALKNGYDFGIQSPENFKGIDFMDLDFGRPVIGGSGPEGGPPLVLPRGITRYYQERKIAHPNGSDIRTHDENLVGVPDGTKIDGLMQDVDYISDKKNEVRKWLAVDKEFDCYDYSSDAICVINFRGGSYTREKDFFLVPDYWKHAVTNMLKISPRFTFIVISDDIKTAKTFFPDYEIFHFSIAKDYSIIKNARYLILSNSSFALAPAWLSTELRYCIAPKYWGRYNISDGYWSLGYNIIPGWLYQDRKGILHEYSTCIKERDAYLAAHTDEFLIETRFDTSQPYVTIPPLGAVAPPFLKRLRRKIDTAKVLFVRKRRATTLFDATIDVVALLVVNTAEATIGALSKLLPWRAERHPEMSREEKEIFNRLKSEMHIVFDVGAREDLAFFEMNPNCEYHLFEPNKRFAAHLQRKIDSLSVDNRAITLNEFGLSDSPADNCVYYEKSQSFEINPYLKEDTAASERFSLRTIDDYVTEHNIAHIDFLKIDAEGLDYRILQGGLKTIRSNKVSYIQFEYWTGVKRFVDLLKNNYRLYLIMEPVLLRAIQDRIMPLMTPEQRRINYTASLIYLDDHLIELIDTQLAPIGLGGNILAMHNTIDAGAADKLSFPVTPTKSKAPLQDKIAYKTKELVRTVLKLTSISFIAQAGVEVWEKRRWHSLAEITSYRKTIKIYDVFTFFNELDLLEIRLNILDPYVDYFVIVEATETFSGYPKPLYFQENKERFKKWEHKIIHYVVRDTPKDEIDLRNRLYHGHLSWLERQIIVDSLTSDNIGKDDAHWLKEFYQKESIKKALVGLHDNDICYISDLDEIWNPKLRIDYAQNDVFKPVQTGYQYYLNNRSNEDWRGWTGTIVTKFRNIKYHCLNHLRTHRKMRATYTFLKNGGWHFAFQGGYSGAKKKLEGYKHSWYQQEEILPKLKERVLNNRDHRGRNIKLWKDERGLPQYLLENKARYRKFFI